MQLHKYLGRRVKLSKSVCLNDEFVGKIGTVVHFSEQALGNLYINLPSFPSGVQVVCRKMDEVELVQIDTPTISADYHKHLCVGCGLEYLHHPGQNNAECADTLEKLCAICVERVLDASRIVK